MTAPNSDPAVINQRLTTDLARKLRRLSKQMIALGAEMDYHGGFDGRISQHGREMAEAGRLVREWVEGIENENASA
jgi:hypothetical protein